MKRKLLFFALVLLWLPLSSCDRSQSQKPLKIPLQILNRNMLHVKISVGGQDLLLVIDTAANITAIDSRILDTLKLPSPCETDNTVNFTTGTFQEKHYHDVSVSIGGHSFTFQKLQVADFSSVMSAVNEPLDGAVGVLGADFLLSTGAVIDFRRKELRIPFPHTSNSSVKSE
jgi:aspartyl protease